MALTLAVGPFTSTYGGSSTGLIEKIYDATDIHHSEPVRAGLFGDAVIDDIYRQRDAFVLAVFKEWTTTTKGIFNPYGDTPGSTKVSGRLGTDLASILVLTAVAGTTAKSVGFATRTYGAAILAPEHVVQTPLGAVNRDVPVLFRIYPTTNSVTGELVHYVDTAPA